MTQRYTFVLFLLSALLFTACSPIRVVRLVPTDPELSSRLLYGNAVLSQTIGEVRADLSYYDASPQFLVFNLEIENRSDTAFDFDPAGILLHPDLGQSQSAIDPELQLLSLDLKDARRRQHARTLAWVGGGLLVAGTVAAVVSETTASPAVADNNQLLADASYNLADLLAFSAVETSTRSLRYQTVPAEELPGPDSRFFWLDHAARITTVRPGEIVAGKVAFRRVDQASAFTVELNLLDQALTYDFYQRVFKP